ncbi:hypothetical protein KJ855_04440 [Patescibacteria group bacterium]|nr:hypothetical protein [Patescibacteria group bacterium]
MNIELIGLTLDVVGTLLIAFAAIMVHHRVLYEHQIDREVENTMKREQIVAKLGVALVIIGYVLQLSVII